jgi:uncharacterized membrane protein YdjX (TVP38/TMEM64 family)
LGKIKARNTALRDKIFGIVIFFALTAAFLWLTFLIAKSLLPLTSDSEAMRRFVGKKGAMGQLLFLGIQILQGFLPIPIELTTVAGGYAFGPLQGTLLTILAMVLSTVIIFYFTKLCGHKLLNLFFTPAQQRNVLYFRDEKVRRTITWIVYLIPGTPKRLFTFSAGLVPQNFKSFLWISIFARVPTILACTFGGHALEQQDYKLAVLIFSVIGFTCLIGLGAYRYYTKRKHKSKKNP